MKCSPLTTWDQYDCGEWDYLTYTRVFDHTGNFDSTAVNGTKFLANWASPATVNLKPLPYTEADQYLVQEMTKTAAGLTHVSINTGGLSSSLPFVTTQQGSRYQFVLTAQELIAAGVLPGAIRSMRFNIPTGGLLLHPVISISPTVLTTLNTLEQANFTEVYNASFAPGMSNPPLLPGWNTFVFYQDFIWDGVTNLLVELKLDNDLPLFQNLEFAMETTAAPLSVAYAGRNCMLAFNGSNYTMSSFANEEIGNAFTIEFWARGNGNIGQNTTFMEALDTAGRRIFNIHMPWSNNNIYFDAGDETGYDRINQAASATEIDGEWNHWAFVKDQTSGQMFIYKNGQLWLSGNNKNREMGYFHRLIIGASGNQSLSWKGNLDELRIYKAALSASTIAANYQKKIDNTHPNWSSLVLYHDFDNVKYARDLSPNGHTLMPSELGMFKTNNSLYAGT
ncbi:MAG: LamG domain-containing protein, partial [Flavobacteriales bacterium]